MILNIFFIKNIVNSIHLPSFYSHLIPHIAMINNLPSPTINAFIIQSEKLTL